MTWLATVLDQEMLETIRKVSIADRSTPDAALPIKTGTDVATELGGRYLLRYVLKDQVGTFMDGSTRSHWVTPTPYTSRDATAFLALPAPNRLRRFVMVLNPAEIPRILGPRWVRLGQGIEYLLPNGFPTTALVSGWELELR